MFRKLLLALGGALLLTLGIMFFVPAFVGTYTPPAAQTLVAPLSNSQVQIVLAKQTWLDIEHFNGQGVSVWRKCMPDDAWNGHKVHHKQGEYDINHGPCNEEPTATPIPATNTPIPPTNPPPATATATDKPQPSNTPEPTNPPPATATATDKPQPSSTPVVPTNTPIVPTNTPIVPTNTPVVPTNTPVVPTNTPVVPTNTPVVPTATKVVVEKTQAVVEAECNEPKVELEARKDPVTGYERLVRIWTTNGVQNAERDLFLGLNGQFDKVAGINDASIEPNNRCLVVVSLMLQGQSQNDLYVFSVNGGYYRQITMTSTKSEMWPEWRANGKIVFTDKESSFLYETDSFGNEVEPLNVGEEQLAGEQFAVAKQDRYASYTAPNHNIVILDLKSNLIYDTGILGENSAWLPDGSGMSYDMLWNLMKVEFGGKYTETIVTQAISIVWSPEYKMNGFGHLFGLNGQRSWLTPEGSAMLMTGKPFALDTKSTLSQTSQENAWWAGQVQHHPLDWEVDPTKYGQQANFAAAGKWVETLKKVDPSSLIAVSKPEAGLTKIVTINNQVSGSPTQGPTATAMPTATATTAAAVSNVEPAEASMGGGLNILKYWWLILLAPLGLLLRRRKPNNGTDAKEQHEEEVHDDHPLAGSTSVHKDPPVIARIPVHASVGPAKRRLWPLAIVTGTLALLALLAFRRRRR